MGDKSPKSKDKKSKQNSKQNAPKAVAAPVVDSKKVEIKGAKK